MKRGRNIPKGSVEGLGAGSIELGNGRKEGRRGGQEEVGSKRGEGDRKMDMVRGEKEVKELQIN